MGYDFTLVRLEPRPSSFPFEPSDLDGSIRPLRHPDVLENGLLSHGGFRANGGHFGGRQHYWRDTPDGGSLNVCIYDNAVYVDTHSHWQYVLELYQFLCTVDPELLILDNTRVVIYDADSYRTFVEDSYARRT